VNKWVPSNRPAHDSMLRDTVERRTLDVRQFTGVKLIDPSFFPNAIEYQRMVEHQMHAEMHRLIVRVASKTVDRKEILVPRDWWQHVKERFAPKWLLKRFPVLQTSYVMQADAYYPDIAIPDRKAFVDVFIVKTDPAP